MKYLLQAGKGQMALFNHARPISEVLKDERTPPRIRQLLAEIGPIKKFGERSGLKPTSNYTEYVKLDRKAAVWVVSASEPLRFHSKEWSFPIVGSFPYLGWFDWGNAQEYAESLKKEGWDVDVRGASAYSTIGWFRDSVLSTMISEGEDALGDLANVILHESVHATIYIKGQSFFNESIASFVADHLTLHYLDEKLGPQSLGKQTYIAHEERQHLIEKKFYEAYQKLDQLYSSQNSKEEKLKLKKEILDSLKKELKFYRDINNATLIQFKTYNSGQSEFDTLLKVCQNDWKRFMAVLSRLTPQSFHGSQIDNIKSAIAPFVESDCR